MSWSASIVDETCTRPYCHHEAIDGMTYNLTSMWRLGGVIQEGTRDLDGATCANLAPRLMTAIIHAMTNQEKYEALNPPNGWGDFEGYLEELIKFARAVYRHPLGVIEWSG